MKEKEIKIVKDLNVVAFWSSEKELLGASPISLTCNASDRIRVANDLGVMYYSFITFPNQPELQAPLSIKNYRDNTNEPFNDFDSLKGKYDREEYQKQEEKLKETKDEDTRSEG